MPARFQELVFNNLLWFIASLLVAVLVWFVATIEANPIEERVFTRVPIIITPDDGMIVTNVSSETARVIVRAQSSTLQLLQNDDIVVRVNLSGLDAGEYTLPLIVEIARSASTDSQPAQITVTLERVVSQQKEVRIDAIPPAVNYQYSLERDQYQAEVSGAPERVESVAYVYGVIDLSGDSEDVQRSISLIAVDANGDEVTGVSIEPRQVNVTARVSLRDDIAAVTIIPRIQYGTLPENFTFSGVDYSPRTVFISSDNPRDLELLGDTVLTEPISLEGRTSDFEVTVPLDLPRGNYIVRDDENNIIDGTVTVDISIREESIQVPFDTVPVVVTGQNPETSVRINPESLSIVLDGPVTALQDLRLQDLQAVIDVTGLAVGTYELEPVILIRQGQITLARENITLLPPRIAVTIIAAEATAEASAESGD
jgi:YbbR domain-containing protein